MTIKDTTLIDVRNLTDEKVVYRIDEDNVRRSFTGFETKHLTAGELRKLYYVQGGGTLLQEYLSVQNAELAAEFGVSPDTIEYNWTVEDVDNLLTSGSEDALKDAIEFGPEGIRDLILSRSVQLPLNDMNKRDIVSYGLGVDLNNMIEIEKLNQVDDPKQGVRTRRVTSAKDGENAPRERRVQP